MGHFRRHSLFYAAGALAGVAGLCAACGGTESPPAPTCRDVELLVAASDYSSSAVGGAPRQGLATLATGLDLGKDPHLARSDSGAFFIARDTDLIFELDPTCGTAIGRFSVHELAPGRGTANPHDAAVAADGTVFVVLYNVPRIALFKNGKLDGTIDLGSFDPDGNPQAEAIRIVPVDGVPKAFVSLERLDDTDPRLPSRQPSFMLRIDPATRVVETAIQLAGRNPFNAMAESEGALFLAEPGSFDAADEPEAGIERFDTKSGKTELLIPEARLGGASVIEVAVDDGCGAAIVAGPEKDINPTSLVTFDARTGQMLTDAKAPLMGPTDQFDSGLRGLAWKNGSLYVGDRRPDGSGFRVHVFDREAGGCALRPSERVIHLTQRPIALRPTRY